MIQTVELINFRNFSKKELEFSDGLSIIVGPNASGKTNILESIFLLATGKSFKAKIEEEMIGYTKDVARVKGRAVTFALNDLQFQTTDEQSTDFEVVLTRGEIEIAGAQIQKTPRKRLFVNKVARRLVDFEGNVSVVLFGPWDLDLITESPSIRRRFLDTVLSQTDREYRRSLLSYEKGLKQRNRILYKIREEGTSRSQLLFWNHLLVKNGDFISQKREELIEYIGEQQSLDGATYLIEYDKSAISEARLEQYKNEEVASATTLVGPHRDDFSISVKNDNLRQARNLGTFGSRGEQRMAVLWIKLAELSYIWKVLQTAPTLLLDDIFSELDHQHRDIVMKAAKGIQTIMTTADPHYIEDIEGANRIELEASFLG